MNHFTKLFTYVLVVLYISIKKSPTQFLTNYSWYMCDNQYHKINYKNMKTYNCNDFQLTYAFQFISGTCRYPIQSPKWLMYMVQCIYIYILHLRTKCCTTFIRVSVKKNFISTWSTQETCLTCTFDWILIDLIRTLPSIFQSYYDNNFSGKGSQSILKELPTLSKFMANWKKFFYKNIYKVWYELIL